MIRKAIPLMLCIGLALSCAACGSKTDSSSAAPEPAAEAAAQEDDTKSTDQTVEDMIKSEEAKLAEDTKAAEEAAAAANKAAETADAASGAMTGPVSAAEIPDFQAGEVASAAGSLGAAASGVGGSDEYDAVYAFASAKYEGNNLIVVPNGTVNDDTVLYNGKTLGGLCDFIDSQVLEEGRTINRKFLYGLVSVQVIDPQLMSTYDQFSRTMIYCLTIANEFYGMDITLNELFIDLTENTKQVFKVTAEGKDDSWVLDGHENKFYLGGGNTEYTSTMFDPQTMAVWSVVLDEYFEVQK